MDAFTVEPVGTVRTCFPAKFGIPRQAGLAPLARGILRFSESRPREVWREALRGIGDFSHLWLTFVFDRAVAQGWRPTTRPPRLGGRERMGVFATRSPHRPNFLGQTLARLERFDPEEPALHLSEIDLLDGTPVLDLRPWHPQGDHPTGAIAEGWIARADGGGLAVEWAPGAREDLAARLEGADPALPAYAPDEAGALVEQILSLDPRPGHDRGGDATWAMRILSFDVRFTVSDGRARVERIDPGV